MGNGRRSSSVVEVARVLVPRRSTRFPALSAALLVGLMVAVPASGPPAGASVAAARVGSVPRLPVGAAAVSPLPRTTALRIDVVLRPRDAAQLASFAQAVSTPGSSEYRHYLSESQFVSRFGPSAQAIGSVRRALIGDGLRPGAVSANHLSIAVRAAAGRLASAFATGFMEYRLADGRIAYANTKPPQLSESAEPLVQTVVGLDDLNLAVPGSRRSSSSGGAVPAPAPEVATGGPQPCTNAVKDATADGALTTDEVASEYDFSDDYGQGDFGAGQTVALYELQGYGASDIASYQTCYGTSTPVSVVDVDGGPLSHAGVSEADVDIEQVVGLAPATHILVYEGPNIDSGGYDTYNSIIAADTAQVISTSWGLCEPLTGSAEAEAESTLFEEAATQGQSVVAASGDEGSEDCLGTGYSNDTLAVDDPASQPYVTGVGGTMWSKSTPPVESVWNDGPTCCWGAGGGGVSSFWAMPSYQTGASGIGTINADSSGAPCGAASGSYCREVPDVSALAGPFPYLQYVGGGWGQWGGTSLAAPLWASVLALSNASDTCSGKNIGFANPVLYEADELDPAGFNDVTSGDNDLSGKNGGNYPALAGYDMASGLGTPNAGVLPALLCTVAPPNPVSITSPGNQTTALGSTVSLPIKATDSTKGQTLTYSAANLPTGLSISSTSGLISATATARGEFDTLVTARAGNGANGSVGFSWTVNASFTSAAYAVATIGQPFSFTVSVTGVPNSLKEKPRPPKGIKFKSLGNGSATLSGTPGAKDEAATYPLVITATYGKGKSALVITQNFSLVLEAG